MLSCSVSPGSTARVLVPLLVNVHVPSLSLTFDLAGIPRAVVDALLELAVPYDIFLAHPELGLGQASFQTGDVGKNASARERQILLDRPSRRDQLSGTGAPPDLPASDTPGEHSDRPF